MNAWKSLPLEYLRDVGGELIFNCNFSRKTLPYSGLPLFYQDVLNAWQKIVAHTPLIKNEVENEIIISNKKLLQLQESQYSIDRGMKPELNTFDVFQHTFRH